MRYIERYYSFLSQMNFIIDYLRYNFFTYVGFIIESYGKL